MTESDIDISNIQDKSPEEIADIIFSKHSEKPYTYQLFVDDESEPSVIHEIIMTILMEGLMKFYNNFKNVDMTSFSEEILESLNPWLYSIGFKMKVEKCDRKDKDDYSDYYCKAIVKCDKEYEMWFDIKKWDKQYAFIPNQKYLKSCDKKDISELYSIFINDKTVYKISFVFYK